MLVLILYHCTCVKQNILTSVSYQEIISYGIKLLAIYSTTDVVVERTIRMT